MKSALFSSLNTNILNEGDLIVLLGPFNASLAGSSYLKLYNDLKPLGLLQFVRSGRISVTKEKMGISEILNTFRKNNN